MAINIGDVVIVDDRFAKVQYKIISASSSSWKDAEEERWKRELREWKEAPY